MSSAEDLESQQAAEHLARRARAFARVREVHQTETAEDYVEMIADLIALQGEARVIDLARHFGVSHATVNKIIARLNKEGLVTNRPYRSVFLTEKGQQIADHCKERHEVVFNFLRAIGVDEENAHLDAEGIEHHVSEATLKAFAKISEKR
jgi:DtxR family manganese transport transcriptional regulator